MSSLAVFASPRELYERMLELTRGGVLVRNFVATIAPSGLTAAALVVETPLFPAAALDFYTRFNLCALDAADPADAALHAAYYSAARGGGQGDYREGIQAKIDNVVACLAAFPRSKRAVLTIPGRSADHTVDADAKCLRELHFYLDDGGALSCTGFMRAQAASIFPKNVHFIGTLIRTIAARLGVEVGTYTHIVTTLVDERAS